MLALLLVSSFAAWNVSTWGVKLRYPGEENLAEGIPLTEVIHLRQGVHIYDPPTADRFDAANYGPLYYLLGTRLVNPARPDSLRLRLASLLATLGCAACCGLLAFWLAGNGFAAALAALIFLAYRVTTFYGASVRSDLGSLFLSLAGFLVAYHFRHSRKLLWATPILLAGFFYKQQFVAAPAGITLFLALDKRYRLALEFAALLAVGGLAGLALFQFVIFRGQAFLQHFLLYNALPFSLDRLTSGLLFFAALCLLPSLIGIEFLRLHRNRLLTCYVGFALPLSILMFGRQGSDANYFLECIALLGCLFAALVAERIGDGWRAAELLVLLALSLILGQFFALPPPTRADVTRDSAIQDFLRRHFPAHTRALGYYSGDLIRAGLDTPISNLYHHAWLVRRGVLPALALAAQIEDRRFGVVVVNFDLNHAPAAAWSDYYLTPRERQAILSSYQPATVLDLPEPEKFRPEDRFYVWIPRPAVDDSQSKGVHDGSRPE